MLKPYAGTVTINTSFGANTHIIRPGDDPQAVANAASAGDHIIFAAGLHQHAVGPERAVLYIDKTLHVTLEAGAILKVADGQSAMQTSGEIITNQSPVEIGLNDLEVSGTYTADPELFVPRAFRIEIDSTGTTDTFRWNSNDGTDWKAENVAVTGDWQELMFGISIRFGATTGHTLNSRWYVCFGGEEVYGIRIGNGIQATPIDDVTLDGFGEISNNMTGNVKPQGLAKNLSSCVLLHGRVRRARIHGLTFRDFDRPVMAYGEHTGTYDTVGGTTGGESFDMEDIEVAHTRAEGDGEGDAYLFGHPEFRGSITRVRCNFNHFNGGGTAYEPNFNLEQFEVIGNTFVSGGANGVHLWRGPSYGRVALNTRLGDNTGKSVVTVSTPGVWPTSTGIFQADNVNVLSDTP